ncbi:MAG: metallophosphoesterase [Oscillospiraceae bacterium]|nr:metallophosphoesterase [Oscillospiraceae bacterium]
MKQKTKHRRRMTICFILTVLLVLTGIELCRSNFDLTVSRYTVRSEKVAGAIRIVFLADLHGREFGADNGRLLEKIAAEKPELIALAGDIFNAKADEDEIDRMCGFIQKASDIAPVYFCPGNHEQERAVTYAGDLLERIRQSGAVVLDADYLDIDINGTPVRLGGYMGYYRTPHLNTDDPVLMDRYNRFFADFEDTDRFKLLLNHIPTNWVDWNYIDKYPVDLVLSGHYHGGLIRIPVLEQGLVAPYVGLFPPYTKGMFTGSQATCILTTGLAGSRVPRFFNPPEIVTVDVKAK